MYQVEKRGTRSGTRLFWELADVYNYIRRSNAHSKVKAEFIVSENGLDIENEQLENSVWAERAVCVKDMENDFDNVTAYLSEADKQVIALVKGWIIAEAEAEAKAEVEEEAHEKTEQADHEVSPKLHQNFTKTSPNDEIEIAGLVIGHDDGGYYIGSDKTYRSICQVVSELSYRLPHGKCRLDGKEIIIKFFNVSSHAKSYKIRGYDVRQTFNILRKIKKAVEGYA